MRSNESPGGAFKRRDGLAQARWRGLVPTSSVQVSVEGEIRNHRVTDISHNMISGGHKHEVRCKSLPFQHGHRLRGAAAPGWKKNFHQLHRSRGCTGHYRFFELVMSSICYLVLPDQFYWNLYPSTIFFTAPLSIPC